jgi:uncharacterized DUF497 family protein
MEVAWDPEKSKWTLENRKLSFSDFPLLFEGPFWRRLDNRKNYGEHRWILMGFLDERLVVAVYTLRGATYRILSMRKANSREEKAFEKLRY